MHLRLRVAAAILLFAGGVPTYAQQPFMLPSNGTGNNRTVISNAPGISSIFGTTMFNKQNTAPMMTRPSLSTGSNVTSLLPAMPSVQSMMLNKSSGGTSATVQTFTANPPRPWSPFGMFSSWKKSP